MRATSYMPARHVHGCGVRQVGHVQVFQMMNHQKRFQPSSFIILHDYSRGLSSGHISRGQWQIESSESEVVAP